MTDQVVLEPVAVRVGAGTPGDQVWWRKLPRRTIAVVSWRVTTGLHGGAGEGVGRVVVAPDGPTTEPRLGVASSSDDDRPSNGFAGTDHPNAPARRLVTWVLAGGLYLATSLVVWWNVWSGHPTTTATCGCGDSSLFTWFLEWPAYALAHGLNPFHSTAMGYPAGVNLLSNTSELAVGTILAPVTWLFGPVASLNVAVTLAPVLSALAMFFLLRRWVTWAPAAFVGGLLYGFSPFALGALSGSYLMVGVAVVPPLVVAALDELLIRQRRSAVVTGIGLGILVAVQFFIGTEALAIMMLTTAFGVLIVVVYAAVRSPADLRSNAHHTVVGTVAGGVTSLVLLAYPTWYAFAGPSHLSEPIWPGTTLRYSAALLRNSSIRHRRPPVRRR